VIGDPQVGAQYSTDANTIVPREIYYDGTSVRTWPEGDDLLTFGDQSMRFFAINLFDGRSVGGKFAFDPVNTPLVAQVSVWNKADEVAQVVKAITELTHVTDTIVISHSMGGLDARA
jgi:hypothetical protein